MTTPTAEVKPVLGPEMAGTLMTPEEFDSIDEYDENYGYELVHGVLVVTPIPLGEETDPNEELGRWLRDYQDQHPEGRSLDLTLPQQYIRTRTGRRLADRVIWTGLGRMPNRRRDLPTVAVEFVSAGRRNRQRDYVDKTQEYHGSRRRRVLDHRPLPTHHDGRDQLSRRAAATGRPRKRDLPHRQASRLRTAPGPVAGGRRPLGAGRRIRLGRLPGSPVLGRNNPQILPVRARFRGLTFTRRV